MRAAVSFENDNICRKLGETKQFKYYDVEGSTIVNSMVISTDGQTSEAIKKFLTALRIDVLICGGIDRETHRMLTAAGIRVYPGMGGKADAAVQALIGGNMSMHPASHCDHAGCCGHSCSGECEHCSGEH